jgi:hypothetical protein
MFTVRAPNTAHNGTTAGVRFTAGVGRTDNPAVLAYFRKAGYVVTLDGPGPIAPASVPVAAPEPTAAPKPPRALRKPAPRRTGRR